jgi:hypothetical protein
VLGSLLIGALLQLVVLGQPHHAHLRALATGGMLAASAGLGLALL